MRLDTLNLSLFPYMQSYLSKWNSSQCGKRKKVDDNNGGATFYCTKNKHSKKEPCKFECDL